MTKRPLPLLHRGYLYAQKHDAHSVQEPIARRFGIAKAWKAGHLAAQREAKANKKTKAS